MGLPPLKRKINYANQKNLIDKKLINYEKRETRTQTTLAKKAKKETTDARLIAFRHLAAHTGEAKMSKLPVACFLQMPCWNARVVQGGNLQMSTEQTAQCNLPR